MINECSPTIVPIKELDKMLWQGLVVHKLNQIPD